MNKSLKPPKRLGFPPYFALFCTLLISACASVPLMSLPKLAALDMETLDIGDVEMAVKLNETVGIKKDTATLFIKVEDEKTNASLTHGLTLSQPEAELTSFLKRKEKPGYKIHRFKLTEAQAAKAEDFRKEALALRDKIGKGLESSLTAMVVFCQFEDGPELENASMTFYVRTNPKKDFFTLFKEQKFTFSAADRAKFKENAKFKCD